MKSFNPFLVHLLLCVLLLLLLPLLSFSCARASFLSSLGTTRSRQRTRAFSGTECQERHVEEIIACAQVAAWDETAVERAEAIFTKAEQLFSCPTGNINDHNDNNDEERRRILYHSLLATYAMARIVSRAIDLLDAMVDGKGPTPSDESYFWLLEAHIQAQDWQGAQQVWESLVTFSQAQPAWSLTSRLLGQRERIRQGHETGMCDDSRIAE